MLRLQSGLLLSTKQTEYQYKDANFSSGIGAKTQYNDELVLTVAQGNPLEKQKVVSLRELKDEPFITFRDGSGLRFLVYSACVREGFEPNVTYGCGSPRILVAEGLRFSIIPRLMAEILGPPI